MTTELEKQFFSVFGIEPKLNDCNWRCQKPSKLIYMCANNNDCEYCKEYPQITDRHYLELICILNKNTSIMDRLYKNEMNIECFKNTVLKDLIRVRNLYDIKYQVQAIFKEK